MQADNVISAVDNTFPWEPWSTVERVVNMAWDPENNPHHVIVGMNGSGKSYLAVNGILKPMCSDDRVLIIDTKGDDPIVSEVGRPIRDLPQNTWYTGMSRRKKPMRNWFRLVTYDDTAKAKIQVYNALSRVLKEGRWVVYLDEGVEVVNPRFPNLGQEAIVSLLLRKGRSKHVPVIFASQAPVHVPRWVFDQASFTWIGRIRDLERQKRLIEIGGMAKQDLPYVSSLEKRQWLLAADPVDAFYRTQVA